MKCYLILCLAAAASLASAQDSTSTNDLVYTMTSPGAGDGIPNFSSSLLSSVMTYPGITFSDLTTLTTISNHIPGSNICQTVTAHQVPDLTIQTETSLPTACTVTFFTTNGSSASGPAITGSTSIQLVNGTTSSSGSGASQGTSTTSTVSGGASTTTEGSASQTGAGSVLSMRGEGLGMAAVLAAVVAWL